VYSYDGSGYNRIGRLTLVQDTSGTTTFSYDARGRITRTDKVVSGTTYTTQSGYDGLGRLTSVTYPDTSVVSYAYTGAWLDKVYEGAVTYAQYANYNALGQPGTLTYGNGVVTTYSYAHASNQICPQVTFRLCTLVTTKGGTTLQNLTYSYDAAGNVTAVTDPLGGNQSYTYDALDRLAHATGPVFDMDHAYDELGNLTYWPVVGHYAYPPSGAGSIRPHAVCATGPTPPGSCSGGTAQYTYDANGNLLTGAGRTLTWDYENRPSSITASGSTTTFVYDDAGGRVKKTVGSLTTTYIGKLYECENALCTKVIWAGGRRLAFKQVGSGTLTVFHPDRLGTTLRVTNDAGTPQETLAYYPFGQQWLDQGPANVPYKFRGQEYDGSTGLYFYQARYYDATLGRFVSADTLVAYPGDPQDLNRYSYARNNPLRYTDPSGHGWFSDTFGGTLGSVIRVVGWVANPVQMAFLDPTTRPAAVGVVVGGTVTAAALPILGPAAPVVAGAAAGAASGGVARLQGRNVDVGLATAAGAAAGAVGAAVGAVTPADYHLIGAFVSGAAGGATAAAIQKREVWQAAVVGGSVSVVAAYLVAHGVAPQQAQVVGQDQQAFNALTLTPEQLQLIREMGTMAHGHTVQSQFTEEAGGMGYYRPSTGTLDSTFGTGPPEGLVLPPPPHSDAVVLFHLHSHTHTFNFSILDRETILASPNGPANVLVTPGNRRILWDSRHGVWPFELK
jgi:RHS repeat-associated protein